MLAWHNIWMARHGMQLARDAKQLGRDVASGNREMSALALVVASRSCARGRKRPCSSMDCSPAAANPATVSAAASSALSPALWLDTASMPAFWNSCPPVLRRHQRPDSLIGGGHDQPGCALPGPSRPPAQSRQSALGHLLAARQYARCSAASCIPWLAMKPCPPASRSSSMPRR